ncbi:MAG: glycosyltransferase family 4 protein [Sedimentisphaerales bacterium]|nr:glycosyltransferase family 4 protein [Sedimentisphaerales bacterium]
MKIIQITPGSGNNFYCENCLRDAKLVQAWHKQGHNALVVPLYLPVQMDEQTLSQMSEIFYGGINVYLQQKSSFFRHSPRWLDWLFDRPFFLKMAARKAGMTDAADLGETTLSMLEGEEGRQVKELERLVQWLTRHEKPEVLCLSNALLIGMARRMKEVLGVPVVCLLQDEDEFLDILHEPYGTQAWETIARRAPDCDKFIAVSQYYRQTMKQRLRIPEDKICAIMPGIRPGDYTPAESMPEKPCIGYLSRITHEKGLDTLVEAFILLKQNKKLNDITLRVAGGKTAGDNPYINSIGERARRAGVARDIEWIHGFDPADRFEFLRTLTVVSVPEKRGPACGTYALEALASGVPVVEPPVGVFVELHEEIGHGMILARDNTAEALAEALAPLLLNPQQAHELGQKGSERIREKFDINENSRKITEIFESLG